MSGAFLPKLSEEEAAASRADLLRRLHDYAHQTGAQAGDDVVRWFDSHLRQDVERQQHERAARRRT